MAVVSRQLHALVQKRAETVLDGIFARLTERQRAKEVYAQLLADDEQIAQAIRRKDEVALARILVPLQIKLELGFISVFDAGAGLRLHLGTTPPEKPVNLIMEASAGLTGSNSLVGDAGLIVEAATPVKGPEGIVGTMLVGVILNGEDLMSVKGRDDAELAVFRRSRLMGSTHDYPEIFRRLASNLNNDWEAAQGTLRDKGFQPALRQLGSDGFIAALIPVSDLATNLRWRRGAIVAGIMVLVTALLFAVFIITRAVIRPVHSMVAVTNDIVQGHYDRSLPVTKIKELSVLSRAINHLSHEIEAQINSACASIALSLRWRRVCRAASRSERRCGSRFSSTTWLAPCKALTSVQTG